MQSDDATTSDTDRLTLIEDRVRYLERRDRRQVRIIVVLLVGVIVLGASVGWLARSLNSRNAAIDSLTIVVERQECSDRAEARFEDGLTEVVVAAVVGDRARLDSAATALEAGESQEEAVASCEARAQAAVEGGG